MELGKQGDRIEEIVQSDRGNSTIQRGISYRLEKKFSSLTSKL